VDSRDVLLFGFQGVKGSFLIQVIKCCFAIILAFLVLLSDLMFGKLKAWA